jgi:sugar lactone lactonase YvrE
MRLGPQQDGSVVLATDQNGARSLVADGGDLFWVDEGTLPATGTLAKLSGGGIMRADKAGPVRLVETKGRLALAADADALYWANPDAGTITRLPRAGGTPQVIASDLGTVQHLAVDHDAIYWIAGGQLDVVKKTPAKLENGQFKVARAELQRTAEDSIWRLPKQGGKAAAVEQIAGIANGLAVDNDTVYWRLMMPGQIVGTPKSKGSPRMLAESSTPITDWAISGGKVYYVDGKPGAFELHAVSASGEAAVLLKSPTSILSLAVTDGTVFYGTEDGTISELTAAAPRVLIRHEYSPALWLAADARNVYWIEGLRVLSLKR